MVFQIKTRTLPNMGIIYFYFLLSSVSVLFPRKRMAQGVNVCRCLNVFALVTLHNKWMEGICPQFGNRVAKQWTLFLPYLPVIPSIQGSHRLVEGCVRGLYVASLFSLSDHMFQFFLCCLVTEGNWLTSFLAFVWTEGKELFKKVGAGWVGDWKGL